MVFKTGPVNLFNRFYDCAGTTQSFHRSHNGAACAHAIFKPRNKNNPADRNGTAAFLNKIQLVAQSFIIHYKRALYHVAVAAQIFCYRMHYNIGTKVKLVLQVWRCKSIINAKQNILGFANAAMVSMSQIFIKGLVGVSAQINFVFVIYKRCNIVCIIHVHVMKFNSKLQTLL